MIKRPHTDFNLWHTIVSDGNEWISYSCPECGAAGIIRPTCANFTLIQTVIPTDHFRALEKPPHEDKESH